MGLLSKVIFFSLLMPLAMAIAADPDLLLKEIWPAAETVKKESLLLSESELKSINQAAQISSKDRVYRVYRALGKDGEIGFGVVLSQVVRTKSMAVLYAIDRTGEIHSIEVLAFREPPEYQPKKKWLGKFVGKKNDAKLFLNQDVENITGATLSARAVVEKARIARQIVLQKLSKKP